MFLFLSWHYRSPYASAQRGSCLGENKGTRKQTKEGRGWDSDWCFVYMRSWAWFQAYEHARGDTHQKKKILAQFPLFLNQGLLNVKHVLYCKLVPSPPTQKQNKSNFLTKASFPLFTGWLRPLDFLSLLPFPCHVLPFCTETGAWDSLQVIF